MPIIRINTDLFKRLESLATGFDTPARVVERLIHERQTRLDPSVTLAPSATPTQKPELKFHPSDEELFKQRLIKHKQAHVTLHMSDGTTKRQTWKAARFNATSNLRANLWSGYLRDWADRGIVKAELNISLENGKPD